MRLPQSHGHGFPWRIGIGSPPANPPRSQAAVSDALRLGVATVAALSPFYP